MKRTTAIAGIGSLVALATLAGCGKGFLNFAEREPWRREAEESCLKSGTVKESAAVARVTSIDGPGVCGASFPLKVAALGDGPIYGYADEIRPPGAVPNGSSPRWPLRDSPSPASQGQPRLQWTPGPPPAENVRAVPQEITPTNAPINLGAPGTRAPAPADEEEIYERDDVPAQQTSPSPQSAPRGAPLRATEERVPLGPRAAPPVTGSVQAQVKPVATLACPMVSRLDRWIADAVQPAAQRWLGAPVVEIKQISSYSCRGMNGNPNARISEHAFGNALDIAAFTLADGRTITVKGGWRGLPEEQGFLREIHAAACESFSTVLSPGSNIYHYDHIHVDLMRRSSGRHICQPAAVSGDAIASRARGGALPSEITGSVKRKRPSANAFTDDDWIEDESNIR